MSNPIPEASLGPHDSMAEHITSNVGLSRVLGGEIGMDYNPKSSPFSSVARLSERDPENANLNVFKEISKMKKENLSNLEQGSSNLFGKDSPIPMETKISPDFHELYDTTNKLSESTEMLIDHLTNQTAPISEHMPSMSAWISQIASQSMGVLHDHKPNLTTSAPLDIEKTPNQSDVRKFNNVANILDKPLSIFSKIKEGTITGKDVQLLTQVYPNLTGDIKASVMKNLLQHQSEDKTPLPSQMRLGLSKLFGENLDSSLTHLSKNQIALAGIGMAQAAQQQQQTRPSKSGISKMKLASADQTKAQASMERTRT